MTCLLVNNCNLFLSGLSDISGSSSHRSLQSLAAVLAVFSPYSLDPCYNCPLALGGRSRKGMLFDSAAVSATLVLLQLFSAGTNVDGLEKTAQTVEMTIL
jgi:hypothetical protein